MSADCCALLIAAPASGQGKTTVTAGLARHYRNRGLRVRVFKCGPDFLDPMVLERACGHPVMNLDLWMVGEEDCRHLLTRAAGEADLILVEGVMGLFDGTPSAADLAECFGLPVLAVIDASAMAQTFAAIASGLAGWRPGLPFAGVFANRIGSAAHREMLAESLSAATPLLGSLSRDPALELPSRHLGLVQPAEVPGLDARLDRLADAIDAPDLNRLPCVRFDPPAPLVLGKPLAGLRIAVAQDEAFAFAYPANLDLLRTLGARLCVFSPLRNSHLPVCDALYLPGGYPELHLDRLAGNAAMHRAIRRHHEEARPIVAECGGMLYLLESLADGDGRRAAMVGLLPGHGRMQAGLANLGLHALTLDGGELRGHTFHHSVVEMALAPLAWSTPRRHHGRPEAAWRVGRLTAGYLHFYFPSNPTLAAGLFQP